MIALSTIPLIDKKTFEFLKTPESATLPCLSAMPDVYKVYAKIAKLEMRDIMNINTFLKEDDVLHGKMLQYISKRNSGSKNYTGFQVLKQTCGIILYMEQVEQLIVESSDFQTMEANMFRFILREGKSRKVGAWKVMYISRLKNIFKDRKDVNKLLNAIEGASKLCEWGELAQKEAKKIYMNAYMKANHSLYYKEKSSTIQKQIDLYTEHGVDIGEDFINFDSQIRKKFKRQFASLTELFTERCTLLARQKKYHSALEVAKKSCVFDHYMPRGAGQTYMRLITAQLYMDTGDLISAQNICQQTLKAMDPEDEHYDVEQKDILGLLEMINGEMWKGNSQ